MRSPHRPPEETRPFQRAGPFSPGPRSSPGPGPVLAPALTQTVAPAGLQDALRPSLGILGEIGAVEKVWVDAERQDLRGGGNAEARARGLTGEGRQGSAKPHLAQECDGLLPHGLSIPDVGADDLSEGLLHALGGRGRWALPLPCDRASLVTGPPQGPR